jgi:hypothetical protein
LKPVEVLVPAGRSGIVAAIELESQTKNPSPNEESEVSLSIFVIPFPVSIAPRTDTIILKTS